MKKGTPVNGDQIAVGGVYRLADQTSHYVTIITEMSKESYSGTIISSNGNSKTLNNWLLSNVRSISVTDTNFDNGYWYGEYIGNEESNPEYFL